VSSCSGSVFIVMLSVILQGTLFIVLVTGVTPSVAFYSHALCR